MIEGEAVHLAEQGHEGARGVVHDQALALGIGVERVAAGAVGIQVLRLPAEPDGALRREQRELGLSSSSGHPAR